jgi:hypothetical protein
MLTGIGVVFSTLSMIIVSLCSWPGQYIQHSQPDQPLVTISASAPAPVPAPVAIALFSAAAVPQALQHLPVNTSFVIVDPNGEERLHSEQHAHRSGSKEALVRARNEDRAEKARKKDKRIRGAKMWRDAMMCMKYETAS